MLALKPSSAPPSSLFLCRRRKGSSALCRLSAQLIGSAGSVLRNVARKGSADEIEDGQGRLCCLSRGSAASFLPLGSAIGRDPLPTRRVHRSDICGPPLFALSREQGIFRLLTTTGGRRLLACLRPPAYRQGTTPTCNLRRSRRLLHGVQAHLAPRNRSSNERQCRQRWRQQRYEPDQRTSSSGCCSSSAVVVVAPAFGCFSFAWRPKQRQQRQQRQQRPAHVPAARGGPGEGFGRVREALAPFRSSWRHST